MSDNRTQVQRSYNMGRIRSKNTRPELVVRKFLFSAGFRYRLHVSSLPGTPDIVLKQYRTAIFVNGCFWHGHTSCRFAKTPATNRDFWVEKIRRNKVRDRKSRRTLQKLGWDVYTIWECNLGSAKTLDRLILQITKKR